MERTEKKKLNEQLPVLSFEQRTARLEERIKLAEMHIKALAEQAKRLAKRRQFGKCYGNECQRSLKSQKVGQSHKIGGENTESKTTGWGTTPSYPLAIEGILKHIR